MGRRGRGGRGLSRGNPKNVVTPRHGGPRFDIAADYGGHGSSRAHFSLSDEARNTERHHSWSSDLRLRHSRIAFVSAGTSKAEELTQVPQKQDTKKSDATVNGDSEGYSTDTKGESAARVLPPETAMSTMSISDAHRADVQMEGKTPKSSAFFIDVTGSDQPIHTGFPSPEIRRSSTPTLSDSSEEVILFAGRGTSQIDASMAKIGDHPCTHGTLRASDSLASTDHQDGRIRPSNPKSHNVTDLNEDTLKREARQDNRSDLRHLGGQRRRRRKRFRKHESEDEILDDYIANIQDTEERENVPGDSVLRQRDLAPLNAKQWMEDGESSLENLDFHKSDHPEEPWDSGDLQDFDGLSTSEEVVDSIDRVLSKRERPSGIQYLVVAMGYTTDDARWLPRGLLTAPGLEAKIREFDEGQAIARNLLEISSSNNSWESDDQLAPDPFESSDNTGNEIDLKDWKKQGIIDEQMARLLTKQEQLGWGSDELILFDGEEFDQSPINIAGSQLDGPSQRPSSRPTGFQSRHRMREPPSFRSATEFADVLDQDPYKGFDIMDQERPSLRRKPKGRGRMFESEISDSEPEQALEAAWDNDRTKKKIRKQEREELRTQGLLGKKGKKGKIDMKAKYGQGISMDQVKTEIREFLLSSMESLSLPPMAQKERKIVHEIANVLKLKSKSSGSGKARYPVLYRTTRTAHCQGNLDGLDAILSAKRFLPRPDRTKKRGAPISSKGRGGFASAAVSYRDGEVVGAAAPELGQENRGRTMLEKMGWSTGTTLGAVQNTRGIVQPVAQVVKTGKAGLG